MKIKFTLAHVLLAAIGVFAFEWTVAQGATDTFAVGADVSGVTELEAKGYSFADSSGATGDVFRILHDMGVNAVRLRVWVDPAGGWCGKADTVAKAKRAAALGMDVMLDFHYSDSWADPGKQPIPAAWRGKAADEVARLLEAHTRDVLSAVKAAGVEVKWVQIGNEIAGGMLWTPKPNEKGDPEWHEVRPGEWAAYMIESVGNNVLNPDNFALLVKTGCSTAKEVYPKIKTIVHFPNAHDYDGISKNLDLLAKRGAKWDMVGVSLYTHHERPKEIWGDAEKIKAFDEELIKKSVRSIKRLGERFGCPVMIVETGFETHPPLPLTVDYSARLLSGEMKAARTYLSKICPGVFYWEPACLDSAYPLGAFIENNKVLRPTPIMDALTKAE